jgi:predicted acetyltransferase
VEFRTITEGEIEPFFRTLVNAFGDVHPDADELEADRAMVELDRTFAAIDDGAIVGCAGVFSQDMVVPGGMTAGTAGLTLVGVLPTHRRRGILRELMSRMLDQAADRGEPLASLFASQGSIYGRFGFATSANHLSLDIALDRVSWATAAPGGRVRLLSREEALPAMRDIHDRAVRLRPGGIVLPPERFDLVFREPTKDDKKPFYAMHEDDAGVPDAFVIYRTKHKWPRGLPSLELRVWNLVAATAEGAEALWRFLFDIDLVARVLADTRPVDEPLLRQLDEPRAARPELDDGLFLRPIDIVAALEARSYATDGRVRVGVTDDFMPALDGTYELTVEAGRGSCRRVDAPADVSCTVHAIGATFLGGASWATLAQAGRAHEHTVGAVRALSTMWRTELAPWPMVYF